MIYKGSSGLKAYVGSTGVDKMYLGDTLVYSSAPAPLPDYLCFTAIDSGTFTLTIPSGLTVANLNYVEYSTDEGATWTKTNNVADTAVTITTPTIAAGGKVYWRGSGIRYGSSTSVYSTFSATGKFNASGHVNSLCYLNAVTTDTVHSYRYYRLFYNCTKLISAEEMTLPSSTASYVFGGMFRGCTAMTISPEIPKVSLSTNACRETFYGCTHLTKLVALFTSATSTNAYYRWIGSTSAYKVPSTCLMVFSLNATDSFISSIQNNGNTYTYILYDTANDKYYKSNRVTECDSWGNVV